MPRYCSKFGKFICLLQYFIKSAVDVLNNCRMHISDDDISYWEANEVAPALIIDNVRDVVHVFINGQLTGIQLISFICISGCMFACICT